MSAALLEQDEEQLEREPDFPYEIVDGEIKELPMSAFEIGAASQLCSDLNRFGMENNCGKAYAEMLFRLRPDQPQRRPDVAFVSFAKWPKNRSIPTTAAWEIVPDLAVEVISPGEHSLDMFDKIEEYFAAGVKQVWILLPRIPRAFIFSSPSGVTVINGDGTLSGGDIVPGFQLPMSGFSPSPE